MQIIIPNCSTKSSIPLAPVELSPRTDLIPGAEDGFPLALITWAALSVAVALFAKRIDIQAAMAAARQ